MMYLQTCFDVTLFLFIFTLSLSDVSAISETIHSDEVEKDYVDDSLSYTSLSQCQTQALKEMCLAKRSGNELVCVQSGVECVRNIDCCTRKRLHCYAGKCVKNVCKGKCGPQTLCTVSINNKAVCSCKPGYTGNPKDRRNGCKRAPDCVEHKDCSSGQLCYAGKCVKNVCTGSCGANTQCTVSIDNKAVCTCKLGYFGNPADRRKGCEPNPIKHKKTFYGGPTDLSWNEAKKYCERKGHKLARILNKEENNQVLEILKDIFHPSHIHGVWLGGYIPHKGEPSYWVNPHAVFDYSYFHPGEPNNKGGAEHCLEFWYANKVWKWSDAKCVLLKPVICEKNNN